MRYLVTGGAGFIGSHLVEHLVGEGHEVVVLDDFSTGKRENLEGLPSTMELIEGSVTDRVTCLRACRGVDFVLHQAALASVPRSLRDPVATHHANVTGTLNILIAAKEAGVRRVVYAASSSAYGNTAELPKHEDMVPRPLSPYAVSKLAGEHYCRAFNAAFGIETVALRYFNIFGPRQDPSSQYSGVISRFIRALMTHERPVIYGDGEQSRDFTYVGNVVDANLRAAETVHGVGQVINIANGERITLNELLQTLQHLTGQHDAQPEYRAPRAGDVRHSLADITQARELLGYEPQVGLEEGLQKTIEWWQQSRFAKSA
jgi:nucleoside-diphosphate-sugar epimerase